MEPRRPPARHRVHPPPRALRRTAGAPESSNMPYRHNATPPPPRQASARRSKPAIKARVGGHRCPPTLGSTRTQETLTAVSSITNEVCRETSSVPVNLMVTVCPANAARLNDFWLYPAALLRLE